MFFGRTIRGKRKQLGLTLKELAEKTGLSISFLSLVERDRATPSLSALVNIASNLEIEIAKLVDPPPNNNGCVNWYKDRKYFKLADVGISYAILTARFEGQRLNSLEMLLDPGYESEEVSHDGEEIVYVLEGTYTKIIDGKEYCLEVGDTAHFSAALPHRWANRTDKPARILWFGDLPLFDDLTHLETQ